MKKTILIYGLLLAALTGLLKFVEYRYMVRDLSMEIYVGIIALFFTGLGIWVGLKLTNGKKAEKPTEHISEKTKRPEDLKTILQKHRLTQREYDVLNLMAKGHSNQEIADQLFVSLNTVKTHSSNLFSKLDVKRRTQAVQKANELGILFF